MKNKIRYQKFRKTHKIKDMTLEKILGYLLLCLVLFLSASTFTGCTTAKVSTVKVERFDVDSTGIVYDLNELRKCDKK